MPLELTIEELAERLNKTVWVSRDGTMKRIYMNGIGYNTRKMKTTAYIFKRPADGAFRVACRVDCPSQHPNWIEQEEKDVIESIERRIYNIINPETEEI